MSASSAGTPKSIFFDDDPRNFTGFNEKLVITVQVPQTAPQILETKFDEFIPDGHELANNPYLEVLKAIGDTGDRYDSKSGVTDDMLRNAYANWLATNPSIVNVLFDWDRTLTKIEGMLIYDTTFADNGFLNAVIKDKGSDPDILKKLEKIETRVTPEDILVYLFGGRTRLDMIRKWIIKFRVHGKNIVILTKNQSCSLRGFRELVDALQPGCRIICSGTKTEYKGSKLAAMLALMPDAITGGRRRKTRRSNRRLRTRRLKIGRKRK